MAFSYATQGTCSKEIHIDVQDGIVREVKFTGGCSGNLKALGILVKGMKVEDVIEKLRGITCGDKDTSCADQLTKALEKQLGTEAP
jgi:uncharacterized protein (TIGR03905 family)